jgi:putative RecB family exonuclease
MTVTTGAQLGSAPPGSAPPGSPADAVERPTGPSLSPSRAADFKTCPLLFRYRTIDRLPERTTPDQVRGTLVHAVLEHLFDLPAAERTPAAAAALVAPEWARLVEQEPALAGLFAEVPPPLPDSASPAAAPGPLGPVAGGVAVDRPAGAGASSADPLAAGPVPADPSGPVRSRTGPAGPNLAIAGQANPDLATASPADLSLDTASPAKPDLATGGPADPSLGIAGPADPDLATAGPVATGSDAADPGPSGPVLAVASEVGVGVAEQPLLDGMPDDESARLAAFLQGAGALLEGYFAVEDPRRLEPAEREALISTLVDDELLIRGYIDRLDVSPTGDLRVVDYKTGGAPREAFEGRALFQLKFYALVLWRTRGVVPKVLRLLYLKDAEVCDYSPDAEELERFERTLLALSEAIERAKRDRDFRPKPSRLCGWCSHQAFCPEFGGTIPPYPEPRQTEPELTIEEAPESGADPLG